MIVHVAAAGEDRGRVVLQIGCGEPSPIALEAAVRIAQAFNSEIESLFVESQQLFQLASYPFAREISLTGRQRRAIDHGALSADLRLASQSVERRLDALARAAEVPLRKTVVRSEPMEAVASACARSGPWNVVALGSPIGAGDAENLADMLRSVADATALVVVGHKARRTSGPVIVALEDASHITAMLPAAERLALGSAAGGQPAGEIVLLLIGRDAEHVADLESSVRLMVGDRDSLRFMTLNVEHGSSAVVAEALRRLSGGFVIAALGGLAFPVGRDLAMLAGSIECPLLLVR